MGFTGFRVKAVGFEGLGLRVVVYGERCRVER